MKKFPSIEQFRNVVKAVRVQHDYAGKDDEGSPIYQHTTPYPILPFIGTVKLHGTNAGVVKYADGRVEFQSRERVLSLGADNEGFMLYISSLDLAPLFERFQFNDYCAVYGEWCGGNIQKGVAINSLPKMFVVFAVKVDEEWMALPPDLHLNEHRIYNILQFPTYEVNIDFNKPELAQNAIIEMTLAVEQECPVGAFFGVKGIGEGIVFSCPERPDLRFKSKGEKHSNTKVKKLASVDTEMLSGVSDFVESVVTENRLEQGITFLKENLMEVDITNTGKFLSWVVGDVLKEESDTIVANQLDVKRVKSETAIKARTWFLNKVNGTFQ